MIIPPNDERRQRYEAVSTDLFFQVMKKKGIENVDEQLIEVYSSTIIQSFRRKKMYVE